MSRLGLAMSSPTPRVFHAVRSGSLLGLDGGKRHSHYLKSLGHPAPLVVIRNVELLDPRAFVARRVHRTPGGPLLVNSTPADNMQVIGHGLSRRR